MEAMMKRILIFLLILSLFGCAAYKREMGRNNRNIAKLEIGISQDSVVAIMGKPRLKEAYEQDDGSIITVLFYYTNRVWADGNATRDEMTPICIKNNRLVGWGQDYYTTNIKIISEGK